ncbi:MAG: hypothetical protein Q9187_003458, partial [Circinaria calcarea]
MARGSLPSKVEVGIIGNGPSALILSFILHGHIPYYNPAHPHPDPILHAKLADSPCLLDVDVPNLTAHFSASRLSYSTQALPINVLLDTLIRPLSDTEPGAYNSCVKWRYEPKKVVSHVVLGNTVEAGGQWADNPVAASWDIGTLSYAEMLSLPGYTIEDHFRVASKEIPTDFYRPSRREVAKYLALYPEAVGISNAIWPAKIVEDVTRVPGGFQIGSHNLYCKRLILASGVFSHLIPARPQLQPLLRLPACPFESNVPLLVVGSGFSAADIIISNSLGNSPKRKIIHIFKWAPDERPSPLRACHPGAYPEYAGVYRRMKLAAIRALGNKDILSPLRNPKVNPFFDPPGSEDIYEGLPNTYIKGVSIRDKVGIVTLEDSTGQILERKISNIEYVIGRRGSLQFLDCGLRAEVLGGDTAQHDTTASISGHSLRAKVEEDLEVAPDVFAI